MALAYVEYKLQPGDKGYTDKPLGIHRPGRLALDFQPNPRHQGRRVEVFATNAEAVTFVESWQNPHLFAIASDLVDEHEQELIRQIVEPLASRIAALEVKLAALEAGKGPVQSQPAPTNDTAPRGPGRPKKGE